MRNPTEWVGWCRKQKGLQRIITRPDRPTGRREATSAGWPGSSAALSWLWRLADESEKQSSNTSGRAGMPGDSCCTDCLQGNAARGAQVQAPSSATLLVVTCCFTITAPSCFCRRLWCIKHFKNQSITQLALSHSLLFPFFLKSPGSALNGDLTSGVWLAQLVQVTVLVPRASGMWGKWEVKSSNWEVKGSTKLWWWLMVNRNAPTSKEPVSEFAAVLRVALIIPAVGYMGLERGTQCYLFWSCMLLGKDCNVALRSRNTL